jgi:hypothetical protein
MKPSTSVTALAVAVALLVGCGNDSESADKSETPTPTATSTPKEKKSDKDKKGGGESEGGGQGPVGATALSKSQLERARTRARALIQCVRGGDAKVLTESNSPKSPVIRTGKGIGVRMTFKGDDAADVYVGGKRSNTRKVKKALEAEDEDPIVYKKRVIFLYDMKPSSETKDMVENRVSRDTV